VAPQVTINYPETSASGLLGGASGQNYGLVTFTYAGRQGSTRATTAREVLPLIHKLGGQEVSPDRTPAYPGYPLVTDASAAAGWFYIAIPILAVAGWWLNQRPPADATGRAQQSDWLGRHRQTLGRIALAAGGTLLIVQLVPYGRDHANPKIGAPAAVMANLCAQLASGPESTLPLGDLRRQVNALQTTLDGALGAPDIGAARAGYGAVPGLFDGVARELATLYPGRCPRLLAARSLAESAPRGTAGDAAVTLAGMQTLRSGLANLGQDLDTRIRQESPDQMVGEELPESDLPSVTGQPAWDSPRTQLLTARACGACHSNQPSWPWYSNVAPLSWFVQHQVDDGRAVLNFSEWDRPQAAVASAAESVAAGRMPPARAGLLDRRLTLTDAERAELATGLQTTLQGTASVPRP
jgi:hypothetical protein